LTQAAAVRPLTIAMIEPPFGTPLVAPVGAPSLLAAGLFTALGAAVAVAAVTVCADEENRLAALSKAKPLPQNRFAVNHCHASSQAGTGQRQWSRGRLEPALFGSPVEWLPNTEPCRSNGRVPSISRLETRYFVQLRACGDDRTDDCAFGAMMSLAPRAAEIQKTTFSDDCRQAATPMSPRSQKAVDFSKAIPPIVNE
jgi:hypothetical protein